MKRKQIKFVVGAVIIVFSLFVLAFTGFRDNRAYYLTVSQLYDSGDAAYGRRLRVEGDVVAGSIMREAKQTTFLISHTDGKTKRVRPLPVKYIGTDPLPDTFRDYAQAVVEGEYKPDGTFMAK